jgi:hypothetical protein
MRTWLAWLTTSIALGCASSPPPEPISAQQRERFRVTVAAARDLGPSWDCPASDTQLRAAESDFFYAEHLPQDPQRARQIAQRAQQQAQAALDLCRREVANLGRPHPNARVAGVR